MKSSLLLIIIGFTFSSCFKLDDNFFNSDNSIVKTYGGLIGVSKSTSLSLKWLDKTEKSTFLKRYINLRTF